MDVLHWVLFGVLPALAVMVLGVGVGGSRWLALALAVALCVPFAMATGHPDWPWRLDWRYGAPLPWLWWSLLAAGVLGSLGDARWLPRALAQALEVALVIALPWLLTGTLRRSWSFEQHVLWLCAAWLATFVVWALLREVGRSRPGLLVPLVGMLALGVDAWLLRAHGVQLQWELAGVGACALLFAMSTMLWRWPLVCGTGAALCITVAHVGLLWCGRPLREVRELPFVLALVVPVPLVLVTMRRFAKSPRLAFAIGLLACGGVAAAAVLVR